MDIFTAIESGNVKEINSLLQNKLSFVKKDKNGYTPLLLAASKLGPVYKAVYNAKKKMYYDKLGEGEEMSALHFACCAGDREFVRCLIEWGADVNERVPVYTRGYTPLLLCIDLKFEDVALTLLGCNADVSIVSSYGLSAIFLAEKRGLRDLTSAMLRMYKSWDVNPVDEESGESYLHLACKYGLVDVVEGLLHHGADANLQIDCTGDTPLHMAKNATIVNILLNYGASLSIQDCFGSTPLHLAFRNKYNHGIVEAMLEGHGQCQENPVDESGLSHLHIACLRGSEAAVKGILENNIVDINAPLPNPACTFMRYHHLHLGVEVNDWTPLHLTVYQRDDTRIAQVLLDAGAEIDNKGCHFNITPLQVAVLFDRSNHVQLLLKWGADLNVEGKTSQGTLLHSACQKLQVEMVRRLLKHGADPNVKQENWKDTPLHLCAGADNNANSTDDHHGLIIRLLVEAGADLETRNTSNKKAIDLARLNKDDRPLRALLFYGTDICFNWRVKADSILTYRNYKYSVEALLEHLEVLHRTNPSSVSSYNSVLSERIHEMSLCSDNDVISIWNACRKEIEILQQMGLDFCLRYSNIFAKNAIEVDQLWQRSEKLVELVESNKLQRFPVYGGRLRRWYDDLQSAPSCLEQALLVVNQHWNIDYYSALRIFRYLKAKDLKAMVKAFEF